MNISIKPGAYLVAVSGGVDSMVLLDMLAGIPNLVLTVAHFNHGMRSDARSDEQLVRRAAQRYGLSFVCAKGHLGVAASEAQAREARYAFLQEARLLAGAQAIVTAHHQDDSIETALINILRGTGRKGLSSLASTEQLMRPLLSYSKQDILAYATAHSIVWHEDSTNASDAYTRNYIRNHIVPRLGKTGRAELLRYIQRAKVLNDEIETLLAAELCRGARADGISRNWFIQLPYQVSTEIMASWLRAYGIREFDRKTITRLTVLAKVARAGKLVNINAGFLLKVEKTTCRITEVATLKIG